MGNADDDSFNDDLEKPSDDSFNDDDTHSSATKRGLIVGSGVVRQAGPTSGNELIEGEVTSARGLGNEHEGSGVVRQAGPTSGNMVPAGEMTSAPGLGNEHESAHGSEDHRPPEELGGEEGVHQQRDKNNGKQRSVKPHVVSDATPSMSGRSRGSEVVVLSDDEVPAAHLPVGVFNYQIRRRYSKDAVVRHNGEFCGTATVQQMTDRTRSVLEVFGTAAPFQLCPVKSPLDFVLWRLFLRPKDGPNGDNTVQFLFRVGVTFREKLPQVKRVYSDHLEAILTREHTADAIFRDGQYGKAHCETLQCEEIFDGEHLFAIEFLSAAKVSDVDPLA